MTVQRGLAPAIESSALGLASGVVRVVESDPIWPTLYEAVRAHLDGHLREVPCTIEHIGSTSVPGLPAKPVLDIAIGAPAPIDAAVFTRNLVEAGFAFQADLGIYGGLFYTLESSPDVTVAHIHVVDVDEFQWRWYLAFRDGLRSDAALTSEYAALKRQSSEAHAADREQYTKAKFEWVLATVSRLTGDDPSAIGA